MFKAEDARPSFLVQVVLLFLSPTPPSVHLSSPDACWEDSRVKTRKLTLQYMSFSHPKLNIYAVSYINLHIFVELHLCSVLLSYKTRTVFSSVAN